MSVRRILWLQAFFALSLALLQRFGNVDYTDFPNPFNQFLFALLAIYSTWLFPIVALAVLFLRKKGELTDFQIVWSILAGVLLYFISFLSILPSVHSVH